MPFRRCFKLLLSVGIVIGPIGATYAQTVTCSLSTPLGATSIATSTGHTEPIAAGPNGVLNTAGGGTLRVTCANIGGGFTAGVGILTIDLGVPITNRTSHPFVSAGIRLTDGTGAFDTSSSVNVGISNLNHSAGAVTINLGTPVAAPVAGITFPASSVSTFDLKGVLVSVIGKSSVSATLSATGTGYSASSGAVGVISAVAAGLLDPTIPVGTLPAALPPGSSGGPAMLQANGTVLKGNFTIRIQENYAALIRTHDQFNGGGVFPVSAASEVRLMAVFNNIPAGLIISDCSVVLTNLAGTATTGIPLLSTTNVTSFSPILITSFFLPMDLDNVDVLWLTCMTVDKGSATLPFTGPDIIAQVTLEPVGAALSMSGTPLTSLVQGQIPRYQMLLQPGLALPVVSILVPTITSINPSSSAPGAELIVNITGTRLETASDVTFSGTGITSQLIEVNPTSVSLVILIDPSALPGPRTVTVTTAEGTSQPFSSFTVTGELKKTFGQVTSQ